jgi:uroporphyrinogen-III synthase
MRKITFFKDKKPNDKYERLFTSKGFETRFVPLFTTRLHTQNCELFTTVPEYAGVIITSQRCVETLLQVQIDDTWRTVPWYCVGPATQAALKEKLNIDGSCGSECNNAESLANYIKSRHTTGRLLFLTGDKTLGTMQTLVPQVETVQVYSTDQIRADELVIDLPASNESFVFFSPSGLNVVSTFTGTGTLAKMDCIAIGKTTMAAFEAMGLDARVAPEPTAEGVLSVFDDLD